MPSAVAVQRLAATEPVGAAEHVVAVDLGDLDDQAWRWTPRLTVSRLHFTQSLEEGLGDGRQIGLGVLRSKRVAHEGLTRDESAARVATEQSVALEGAEDP